MAGRPIDLSRTNPDHLAKAYAAGGKLFEDLEEGEKFRIKRQSEEFWQKVEKNKAGLIKGNFKGLPIGAVIECPLDAIVYPCQLVDGIAPSSKTRFKS